MKDNLFEILLRLCEKSLVQLQKNHHSMNHKSLEVMREEEPNHTIQTLHVKSQQKNSTRIMIPYEQIKLTKASYQFLMRMKLWGIIDDDFFELVMNELLVSESRIITEEEIKWTIRSLLARQLGENDLAFLDLVLYQEEDGYTIH